MKLVWFGGTAIRLHIAGRMIVGDAQTAVHADPAEVVSGADRRFAIAGRHDDLPPFDPTIIRRKARTALEVDDEDDVLLARAGTGTVIVSVADEPPVLLLAGDLPQLGRWADNCVAVLFPGTEDIAGAGRRLLREGRPKLITLALPEGEAEAAFSALAGELDGAALTILQPGLALET